MRDGAVAVRFHPRLSAEQYAEFIEIVEHAVIRDEMRRATEAASKRWNVEFEFEEVGV
jgi:hypothetical protein